MNKIYLILASVVIISTGLMVYFIFSEMEKIEKSKIESIRCANLNENALLNNCDLHGINLPDKNLSGANLHNADLSNTNLHNADLSNANLVSANLTNANLASANLRGVNLNNADLINANLAGVDLTTIDSRSADFTSANLIGATIYDSRILFSMNITGANVIPTPIYHLDE